LIYLPGYHGMDLDLNRLGDIVMNLDPAAGEPGGWICVAGGNAIQTRRQSQSSQRPLHEFGQGEAGGAGIRVIEAEAVL
jgi:hypothetical protein